MLKENPIDYVKIGNLSILFFGGVGEVGGNIIVLDYKGSRIVLDLGLSFNRYRRFYEWPIRRHRGIDEMARLGVANWINGLYTKWILRGNSLEPIGYESNIHAVFISHAHLDHIGLLSQINRDIPVYIGETGYIIEETRRLIGRENPYESYEGVKLRKFRTGDIIKSDVFTVKPIHVDHSIPGSYGFIIETPEGLIAYTGDYRLHGEILGRSLTRDFIERAAEDEVELLITEGTRIQDSSLESEIYVLQIFKDIFRLNKPILLTSSRLDIDRLETIIHALDGLDKYIAITDKHFIFIWNLIERDEKIRRKIKLDVDRVKIISTASRIVGWRKKYYDIWISRGFEMLGRDFNEIYNDTIYLDFTEYLNQLYNAGIPSGSIAIFSNSEPFNEESMISQEKVLNWLYAMGVPSYRIHSSGHIHPIDLKRVVEEVKPNKIYIIHSEYPDTLYKFLNV